MITKALVMVAGNPPDVLSPSPKGGRKMSLTRIGNYMVVFLVFLVSACSSGVGLDGEYVSESGRYKFNFKPDGKVEVTSKIVGVSQTRELEYKVEDGKAKVKGAVSEKTDVFNIISDDCIECGGLIGTICKNRPAPGPLMSEKEGEANLKAARAQMALFETALDTYRLDVGKYPSTEQGLQALRTKPSNAKKWDGPYLPKAVPDDPWGNSFVYRRTVDGELEIISLGANGTEGGEGEDKDISSRR